MGRYWRMLADYDAETTTYSQAAGPGQSSPYTPDEDAKLIGLRAIPGRTAATTLLDQVQFRLTCTTFKPNTIHAHVVGSGLQTAPAVVPMALDFEVNQPVKAGVPITIEGRNLLASAVTVEAYLYGLFES